MEAQQAPLEESSSVPDDNSDKDSDSDSDKQYQTNSEDKQEEKHNFEAAFDRAKNWYLGVVGTTLAHRHLAEMCEKRSRYLNVTRVIFNSIVSSAIFTSIGDGGSDKNDFTGSSSISSFNSHYALQIGAGSLSIIVAILTAISSALDYEGRKEAHSNAKRAFSKIKHQMEILLFIKQTPLVTTSKIQPMVSEWYDELEFPRKLFDMNEEWAKVVADWEQVDMDSPDVPGDLKNKFSENQTSIIDSLKSLDPNIYSPNIIKKIPNDEHDSGEEY